MRMNILRTFSPFCQEVCDSPADSRFPELIGNFSNFAT